MTTTGSRFSSFLANLQLTDDELKDAITKHNGVRKALHIAYYGETAKSAVEEVIQDRIFTETILKSYKASEVEMSESKSFSTSLLVGSYGKNTEISPPSDIDILFIMPPSYFSGYDGKPYNGQSQLLQDVKSVLLKRYPRTDIRADGQIVLVPFETYKVEVLPAFFISDEKYFYPDTNNGGSWKYTAPRAEKRNISDSNKRSKGNTIRLIKMIKAWKRYCNVPIKSLVIELRAVNFLSKWEYYDKTSVYYDWMVRDYLKELIACANFTCQVPGIDEKVNYGDAWKSRAETAYARAVTACSYEASEQYAEAALEWRKIFGTQYPYSD